MSSPRHILEQEEARLGHGPLPMREGVLPSYVWLPHGKWPSLLAFLTERFPAIDTDIWRERMRRGEVRSGGGQALGPDARYPSGEQLWYYREVPAEPQLPFTETILYQDAHLLVADKPHFMAVSPVGRFLHQTLLVRLRKHTGLSSLVPIHRLDRETAGLVAFSVDPASRGRYQALFRNREVEKRYEALAAPCPAVAFAQLRSTCIVPGERFFTMREAAGPPNAHTRIDVLQRGARIWKYGLQPLTGKTHQLRLHMLGLGCPILNDLLYPVVQPVGAEDYERPLQLLARSLSFTDPISGAHLHFESRLRLQEVNQMPAV